MKRLYDENDEWTEKGHEIATKINPIITEIFRQYFAYDGYSARDIENVLKCVVSEVAISNIVFKKFGK